MRQQFPERKCCHSVLQLHQLSYHWYYVPMFPVRWARIVQNVLKVSLFTSSYIFERTANYFINFLKNRLPRKIITSVGLNAYAQLSVTEVLSKDDVSPSFLILFIFLKRLEKIRSLFHCLLSSHFDL